MYESTGGYYSILLNPTDEGPFNPFSIQEVRYAVNFLVDRDLIVNELLGGFGTSNVFKLWKFFCRIFESLRCD